MKKFFLPLFLATSALYAQGCDSDRCLPPESEEDHLFPRCKSFFGTVDFLYWTVKEGALSYAIKDCPSSNFYSTIKGQFPHGDVQNGSFNARPGVRFEVGYYNAPNHWEIAGGYTYFKTHGSECVRGGENPNHPLISTFPLNLPPEPTKFSGVSLASCCTELKYQIGDLGISRVFIPNPHLKMRFLGGITGAFLTHELDARYKVEKFDRFVSVDWNYRAGGLRVGLTGDWWLHWQNLYLSGKATLAGFMGRYRNTFCENSERHNLGLICYEDTRFAEQIQLLLGPSWQCVTKSYYYSILVGYELNGWFNLQETPITHYTVTPYYKPLVWNTSAIALHGLTVRFTGGF